MATAALRWNRSGARVRLRAVGSRAEADLVVSVDDGELATVCGGDCLGYSSAVGRPGDGHSRVLLSSALGGEARPLAVWVAAHELGHGLGLRDSSGGGCSLMSGHAFDTRCAPSPTAGAATSEQLACVPAPADVRQAVGLYGGRPARPDSRCR